MKTNSKEVRNKIKQHVLDCVYDVNGNHYDTFDGAAKRLMDEFKRVADHTYNLKKIPNNQERFSDYLWGLPFSFEYANYAIQDYLNSLGINPTNKEYDTTKSNNLYHYLIWSEVCNEYYELPF